MLVLRDFLTNFHIGTASGWDIFIILIFLVAVLMYALFLGRNRIVVLLLSGYFAWFITQLIPWSQFSSFKWFSVSQSPSSSLQILIFIGCIFIIYFLIPRSFLSSVLRIKKRGEASWWQLLLLGIAQVGFLAMAIFSFLSLEKLNSLAPFIKKTFIGEGPQFAWVLLPILIVLLMKRKKSKESKK